MAFLSCFSSPLVNPNWGDSCWNITFHWRRGGLILHILKSQSRGLTWACDFKFFKCFLRCVPDSNICFRGGSVCSLIYLAFAFHAYLFLIWVILVSPRTVSVSHPGVSCAAARIFGQFIYLRSTPPPRSVSEWKRMAAWPDLKTMVFPFHRC